MKMRLNGIFTALTCMMALFVLCAFGSTVSAADETSGYVSDPEGFVYGDVSKRGVDVAAVYLGIEKQPFEDEDGEEEMKDTIWIYYTDNTFEQFALIDDKTELFSIGNYEFKDGGDFIYDSEDEDHDIITINRTKKWAYGKGLSEYESSHEYDLQTIGFTQVYSPGDSRKVVTIFSGPKKQPFVENHSDDEDEDDKNEMIDTWWIFFDDGSFDQYAEVHDKPELFSAGSYEFSRGGDFYYKADEEDHGAVAINRISEYEDGVGLKNNESSQTYDLGTSGYDQLFVILPSE